MKLNLNGSLAFSVLPSHGSKSSQLITYNWHYHHMEIKKIDEQWFTQTQHYYHMEVSTKVKHLLVD